MWINSVNKKDCEYETNDKWYIIDASCVLEKNLPSMNLSDIIGATWDQITDFSWVYLPFEESFTYYWAYPIFSTKWNKYLQNNSLSKQLLLEAIKHKEKILITYNELAQYYAEHLSYFVADKDISNLWRCSLQNYLVALNSIDNYVLPVNKSFNANQHLIYQNGYCRWQSEQDFLFYGGVCWMISQLFRVSLLNPEITITKRFSHNERFAVYYWETVWGDDAAIYERSKQFEILNNWDSDILFKVRNNWDSTQLIAISRPTEKWVQINKNFIDWRETAVHLEKRIFEPIYDDKTISISNERIWLTKSIEAFDSYYSRKNHENR